MVAGWLLGYSGSFALFIKAHDLIYCCNSNMNMSKLIVIGSSPNFMQQEIQPRIGSFITSLFTSLCLQYCVSSCLHLFPVRSNRQLSGLRGIATAIGSGERD